MLSRRRREIRQTRQGRLREAKAPLARRSSRTVARTAARRRGDRLAAATTRGLTPDHRRVRAQVPVVRRRASRKPMARVVVLAPIAGPSVPCRGVIAMAGARSVARRLARRPALVIRLRVHRGSMARVVVLAPIVGPRVPCRGVIAMAGARSVARRLARKPALVVRLRVHRSSMDRVMAPARVVVLAPMVPRCLGARRESRGLTARGNEDAPRSQQ
ncbi:MAG: hypothetical protein ABSG68_19160 [Thermoguttaceae bacterium]